MKTLMIVAAGVLLAAGAARAADAVGVPACDEFLTKYDACISTKVPAAQQATFKTMIDQMRSSWAGLAKSADTKPQLEAACKTATEQVKPMLTPHGCSF